MARGEVFGEATLKMVKDFLDRNTFNPKIALVRARPCDSLRETTRVSVLERLSATNTLANAPFYVLLRAALNVAPVHGRISRNGQIFLNAPPRS